MKCPGKYKYKNLRMNRYEEYECKKETNCKNYTFRTAGRKIPISTTKECEHYINAFNQ